MTTGTVQTSFSNDNPVAKAGMVLSDSNDTRMESFPCGATALDFGVVVEIVSGLAVIAQGTGNPDANAVRGITVYRDTLEGPTAGASTPLPYQPGDNVVVLRKGIIAAQCVSGTTVSPGLAANFAHSSTLAGNNGLITSAAASGTAGSEVSALPGNGVFWRKDLGLASATVPLAAVEINMP